MRIVTIALNAPARNLEFIAFANHVVACFAAEPLLASSTPKLSAVQTDIAALERAQLRTRVRQHAKAARDAKRAVVHQRLQQLRSFLRTVIQGMSLEDAIALVARSGFSVKNAVGPSKVPFRAKQGRVSGTVTLYARAMRIRGTYEWQSSLDGILWISAKPTASAKQRIVDLTSGRLYHFRYRTVSNAGVSDWSQVVTLLVT